MYMNILICVDTHMWELVRNRWPCSGYDKWAGYGHGAGHAEGHNASGVGVGCGDTAAHRRMAGGGAVEDYEYCIATTWELHQGIL